MKKVITFLMLLFATSTFAESGYAEHALMVHRLSYWAPEFLTVTNNWNNFCFTNATSSLKTLSVITEINGQSTKDMDPMDFYSIIDNASSFTITYISKIRGENKTYTQQLNKRKGKLQCYDYSTESWPYYSDEKWYYTQKDEEEYIENEYNYLTGINEPKRKTMRVGLTPKESTTLMSDQNTDFFKYCTFDYMVSGDDYMIDLGLAQALAKELERKGLKYDPKKPDIYMYLTKDAKARIESIYSPNIISTTSSSSVTVGNMHIYYGNYSTWGSGKSRTTGSATTSTYDAGQTKTFVDADLFLQVSILDANKMDEQTPPVVWQMVHNKHFKNETNIHDWIKRLHCAVYCYPLSIQTIGRRILTWGLFFQASLSKTGVISDVANGGWADVNGVQKGNILKKIVHKSWNGVRMRKYSFVPGKGKECNGSWLDIDNDDIVYFDKFKIENSYRDKNKTKVCYYFIPESELE